MADCRISVAHPAVGLNFCIPQPLTQPDTVMRTLTPGHRRNGVHGVQMANDAL